MSRARLRTKFPPHVFITTRWAHALPHGSATFAILALRTIMVKLLTPEDKKATHGPSDDNHHSSAASADASRQALAVSEDLVENLVKVFKLLSDETRLRVLYYLTERNELHVRALCDLLHESQPAVSHHLALLREAGLIERRREGKHNYYGLKTRQISKLLDMLFAAMPEGKRRIRIDDYLLSHTPL